MAKQWHKAEFDAADAARWRQAGVTLHRARLYRDAGVSPEEAGRLEATAAPPPDEQLAAMGALTLDQ